MALQKSDHTSRRGVSRDTARSRSEMGSGRSGRGRVGARDDRDGRRDRSDRRDRRDRDGRRDKREAAPKAEPKKDTSLGAKYSTPERRAWARRTRTGMYSAEVDPLDPSTRGPSPDVVERAFRRGVDPRQQEQREAADTRAAQISADIERDVAARLGPAMADRPALGQPQAPRARPALGVSRVAGPLQTQKQEQLRTFGFLENVGFYDVPRVAEEFGPGEALMTERGPQFQPERGFAGQLRDVVLGYERGISPATAETARQRGVLGELTTGLRRGVVQTEAGAAPRRDVLGQVLGAGQLALDVMTFPVPALGAALRGNLMGMGMAAAPVTGIARDVAGIIEESQAVGALAGAGMVAPRRRTTPVLGAPTGAGSRVAARPAGTPATVAPVMAHAPSAPALDFEKLARERASRRGFASTIRTTVYGARV